MRVLIANHHLDQRAGSELYCLELATALQRFGHEVALFTFVPGLVSSQAQARGIPVFTPHEARLIERFNPDVLQVQHAPCLYFLASLDIHPATLFSSLGPASPMEAAPPTTAGLSGFLAVSEEVRERLGPGPLAGLPTWIARNWFNDLEFQRPVLQPPRPAQRIAVVTNHLDATLRDDLEAICTSEAGLEWQHLGIPTSSVDLSAELLAGFDRVVTIGRTVLLAGAMGIPCLMYDLHGSDGLLEAHSLPRMAQRNLSGRTLGHRPSRSELRRMLVEDALEVDTLAVADLIWADFSLSKRAAELERIYQHALEGGTRLDAAARSQYGALGRVHAELIAELRILRASHAEAWVIAHQTAAERNAMRDELQSLRLERAHLHALGPPSPPDARGGPRPPVDG